MIRFRYNGSMTEPLRTFVLFLLHLIIGLVAVVTLHDGLVITLFILGMLVWSSRLFVVLRHYYFAPRKK